MEEEKSTDIDLGLEDLLGILRQCWIIMLAVALVVGAGLYVFLNATHTPKYTAEAIIHVGNTANGNTNASVSSSDLNMAKDLIEDCKYVVTDRETVKTVIDNMDLIVDNRDTFASNISVTSKTGTRFVVISVTADNAEEAADVATELARVSCGTLNSYYSADDKEIFKIHSEGEAPDEISNPVSKLTVLLIAFAAAVVVYVIYLIMFLLDDKINGPEEVEKYLQLSILGQIPNKQDAGRKKKYYAYDASSK